MIHVLALAALVAASPARAEEAPAAAPAKRGEKLDVDSLKERYWKGASPEIEIVQNRIYTKKHRLNVQAMYGFVNSNPFLDTTSMGGLVGFHFTETLGIAAIYWKYSNKNNSGYDALVDASGYGANSNPVSSAMAGELSFSMLYGKLSLVGWRILHFDLFFNGGAASLTSQNGKIIAPYVGVGQQLYLTRWLSLRTDYRRMYYSEDVIELFRPATLGQNLGRRSVQAGAFNIGLNVLL
jgi:outer membrane beta-barrel protein